LISTRILSGDFKSSEGIKHLLSVDFIDNSIGNSISSSIKNSPSSSMSNSIGMKFILVSSGEFDMGSQARDRFIVAEKVASYS
jgi:hypothetical protein